MKSQIGSVEVKTFVTGVQLTLTKQEAEKLIRYLTLTDSKDDDDDLFAAEVVHHLKIALHGKAT